MITEAHLDLLINNMNKKIDKNLKSYVDPYHSVNLEFYHLIWFNHLCYNNIFIINFLGEDIYEFNKNEKTIIEVEEEIKTKVLEIQNVINKIKF